MSQPETYTIYGYRGCSFCDEARMVLATRGLRDEYHDVKQDRSKFTEMVDKVKAATGQNPTTVPQIFAPDGSYIGGCDALKEKFDAQ